MKTMLQKFSKLAILSLVVMMMSSFAMGSTVEIGDVVMDYGFEADQPLDSLEWAWQSYWGYNDYAPDTVFWEGDTLIKGEDFDASDIDSAAIVSDEFHTGEKSLFLTNATDTISTKTVATFELPDSLQIGGEYMISFWTKYEIMEGEADYRQGWYDSDIAQTWTGLSDGWEKMEFEVRWMGDYLISFGLNGKGQVWIDDVKIEQTGEQPSDLSNNGFEEAAPDNDFAPNNWYTIMGIIGYANDGEDSTNYAYVDGEGVNGSKCVKFQHNIDDTSEVGWLGWCQDFPMLPNHIYEVSCDVKISNMHQQYLQFAQGWYYVEKTLIDQDDERLDETGSTDGWITVKDTVYYPAQASNYHKNIFRLELNGSPVLQADSLLEMWVDNVRFKDIGVAPLMVKENYNVVKNEGGTYTVNFENEEGVSYTVLQQPVEWTEEENLLGNPQFEDADSTGSIAFWSAYDRSEEEPDNFDPAFLEWLPADQGFGIDGSGCAYIGPEDPDNQPNGGACAAWQAQTETGGGWIQPAQDPSQIYLYRAMAKYNDIEIGIDRSPKVLPEDNEFVFDNDPTPEDSVNISGVYIFPRYYWDTFHYPKIFTLGYDRGYGTSDGWEEQAYPVQPNDLFWRGSGHYFQLGLGSNYPSKIPNKGEVFFDNAAIVPFEEVMTGVSGGSFTITPSEDIKWLGIRGENASGVQGAASVIYIDTAQVEVAVDEEQFAKKFSLEQNYPNPFNPTTHINYYLPNHEVVNLYVYDLLGREVAKLVNNKPMTAGSHKVEFDASTLASGVYFYKIKAGNHVAIKKMMLLK